MEGSLPLNSSILSLKLGHFSMKWKRRADPLLEKVTNKFIGLNNVFSPSDIFTFYPVRVQQNARKPNSKLLFSTNSHSNDV